MLAFAATKKQSDLRIDLSSNLPESLIGDPGCFKQVLMNIIGNAIKFTNRCHVLLRASTIYETDRIAHLKFEIQDTGIGIPKATIDRLFTPFTQPDTSTHRHFGGTGLGLSICKSLVFDSGEYFKLIIPAKVKEKFWKPADKKWINKQNFNFVTLKDNGISFKTKFSTIYGEKEIIVLYSNVVDNLKQKNILKELLGK